MTAISHCLWFDGQAEEAARFYVSLFPDGRITRIMHAPLDTPAVGEGKVLVVEFTIAGADYMALNGGPNFNFTPAISIFVQCESQAEVDRLWDALADGGKPIQCGWITDRYGLTWQIVPRDFFALTTSPDQAAVKRTFEAMMGMVKLDLPALRRAFDGAAG